MNNEQIPLWTQNENVNVIDSTTPFENRPQSRIRGYDTNGIPREGVVLSSFVSEGTNYVAIRADDGGIYTVTTRKVILG